MFERLLIFEDVEDPRNDWDAILYPDAKTLLTQPQYVDEHRTLMPAASIKGRVIRAEFADLIFHFLVAPVDKDYVDFRLTDDNRYELLCINEEFIASLSEEYLNDAAEEMEDAFDEREDPRPMKFVRSTDENPRGVILGLQVADPCWCQATYEKRELEGVKRETDYTLSVFKDENGEALEFIGELRCGEVFGSYYLFYSPGTRLVRQFFQCT